MPSCRPVSVFPAIIAHVLTIPPGRLMADTAHVNNQI